ncbi:WD domain, G-beta repeat, putative [Leishmania donovani]|uniref:WD domain, G-beta repeat, putative n=1 Tax=Leishmania donovani TaxID=5661 RepID=A0A3S7WZ61_LEIDO|nr:WD domain, G-beta repeat, putative [Leishmania donovani]
MLPRKTKRSAAAAAAPPAAKLTPTKRAAASPAKPSTNRSPRPQSVTTPIKRSSVAGDPSLAPSSSSTPQRQQQPQVSQPQLYTPEVQRSQSTVKQARESSFASSPQAIPPAPANSPAPASSRAPQRRSSASQNQQSPSEKAASAKANSTAAAASTALTTPASPVSPTSPPPSLSRHERPTPLRSPLSASPARRGASGVMNSSTSAGATPASTGPGRKAASTAAAGAANVNAGVSAAAEGTVKSSKSARSRSVRRSRARAAVSTFTSATSSAEAHFVERFIRESKVIAPDVSGILCLAVHPSEQELIVARENGSLVRYDVAFFQGVPQFVRRRHTGGQTHRTISGLAYVTVPTSVSSSSSVSKSGAASAARHVLLASMMSGQIVVYDAELLVPIALHQRSGGAIWALHAVSAACIYAAMADGSWQQLRLTCKRDGAAPQLELVRVVPGISGADRALSVTTSLSLRMAVGTDDAGNVHAWRLPAGVSSQGSSVGVGAAEEDGEAAAPSRARGLAEHESLWTTKLAKGIALSCAVVGGTQRPCAVVGTSMGDVVLLDAAHGHVFQTFSQHKGPVSTLAVQGDAVVYASGWHESLRSYRCNEQGDWYPAEVKRRTHYHEASQLALLPHRRLILSASRDGTIMYAPTAQLFTLPAMYVVVTTQQFAYAVDRELLLQSRFDTIEVFHMDSAARHWVPFFGHRLDGRFHLSGLWCDRQLNYIVFSTEERIGLLKVVWRAHAAMSVSRLEAVLELPARSGVVDVCWSGTAAAAGSAEEASAGASEETTADASALLPASQRLYILYDDSVTCVTLADGYPVVHTPVQVRGKRLPDDSLRPYRVLCRPTAAASLTRSCSSGPAPDATEDEELVIYGHRGSCRMRLMADGTPEADSLVADLDDVYELAQELPLLQDALSKRVNDDSHDGVERTLKRARVEASASSAPAKAISCEALIGLSTLRQRYFVGSTLHSSSAAITPLSATLPHDVRWIARIAAFSSSNGTKTTAQAVAASYRYLGYFSRGLLVATGDSWHMVRRMCVEAAFLIKGGTEVLVLERNLEKTLEALPLCWKVRRFGN